MRFKKLIMLSIINCTMYFLCIISSHVNAQELTLKKAHELMLAKNGDINASMFEVKAMEEEHKAMKGLKLPTVGVSGTYLRMDDDLAYDLNEQRDMAASLLQIDTPEAVLGDWNVTLQEKNLGFATADVSIPLYAGGKIRAANKASEIKLDVSENNHELTENELTINLISYFFKLKLAIEVEKLRQDVYNTVLLHNNQATKFFENGMIPEVETLNAQVALSNANRELLAAKKDISLATTALQNLINVEAIGTISTKFTEPKIVEPLTKFQEDMLKNNKQLKLIEKNHELAEMGVKIENSEYYPKVEGFGKYVLWTDNLPLAEDTKWMVGLGFKWDLFNGFQRNHKIKASKYKVDQVEAIDKQARLNLSTYTEKLYNKMEKELEQYESLNSDETLAEKLKFMRTRGFEEGTGTSLEVVDATLKLTEIKLHKIKALYEFNLAYGQLMVLIGETDAFLNENQYF